MRHQGLIFFAAGFAIAFAIGWFLFPILLYKNEAQPLQFSHAIHAGEKVGMSCTDCHFLADDGRFQGIPLIAKCAECHAGQLGESTDETKLVEQYATPNKEVPWLVYSRQPDNAYFPHASHLKLGELKCEDCHGQHGQSEQLRVYQVNRITGYSRDIWGQNISGIPSGPWQGMKMDRCVRCHAGHGRKDGCIDCHK